MRLTKGIFVRLETCVLAVMMITGLLIGIGTNVSAEENNFNNNEMLPCNYFLIGRHGALCGNINELNIYGYYNIETPYIQEIYPYKKAITSYIWRIDKDTEGYYEIAPLEHNDLKMIFYDQDAFLAKNNDNDNQKWIIKRSNKAKPDDKVMYTISPKIQPAYQMGIADIRDNDLKADATTSPVVNNPVSIMGDDATLWDIKNINFISSPPKIKVSVQNISDGVLLSLSSPDGSAVYYTDDGQNPIFSSMKKKYTEPILVKLNQNNEETMVFQSICVNLESDNSVNPRQSTGSQFDDYILTLNYSIGNDHENYLKTVIKMQVNQLRYTKMNVNKRQVLINEEKANLDVVPYIDKSINAPMMPIRFIAEMAHASVIWDNQQKNCTIITAEGNIYKISGKPQMKEIYSGIIKNNRLLVPLDSLTNIFNAKTNWNKQTDEITVEI